MYASAPTWLEEAYSFALASTDTGVVLRNGIVADLLTSFAWVSGLSHKRGLDVGGGHGLLVRMLRDRGLDFRWTDKHAKNLLARGFEDDGGDYAWLTLVEVFEHLPRPYEFLRDLVEKHAPECIFFTTELKTSLIPPSTWRYWSFETGQHIGFAAKRSLEVLAKRLGYSLASTETYHLLYRPRRHRVAYAVATARFRPVLSFVARKLLRSLTMPDHYKLSASLRDKSE